MRCREASELMSVLLDEELLPEQVQALQDHLSLCPACQDEWICLQRVSLWLSDAPVVRPPVGFKARVMSRVEQRQRRPRFVEGMAFLFLGAAFASALAILWALLPLVDLWRTANTPALFAGLPIVLLPTLKVLQSVGQALWTIVGALATICSHPLFMSYGLCILLLTTAWVMVVRLHRGVPRSHIRD